MEKNAIVLFDGYCRLCNGTVSFLRKRDKNNMFQFEPLNSEQGKLISKNMNDTDMDTVILIYKNNIYTRSDAFIKIMSLLSFPWKMLRMLKIIPRSWRDKIYVYIANNRYRWFKTKKSCDIN